MGLKGFYFSLDALTASMILIAVVGMLTLYQPNPQQKHQPYQLDFLETASIQKTSSWNESIQTKETVLTHLYKKYYGGQKQLAEERCLKYFENDKKYNIYFANTSARHKICGNLNIKQSQNLVSQKTQIPHVKINNTYQDQKAAIMVVKD